MARVRGREFPDMSLGAEVEGISRVRSACDGAYAPRHLVPVTAWVHPDLLMSVQPHRPAGRIGQRRRNPYLGAVEHDLKDARLLLLQWFEDDAGNEPVLGQEVGIVLASANFSQEITTTVLWLNDQYGTDIRCIRLSPYRHQGRLLLDVQHVIPLPEAATSPSGSRSAKPPRASRGRAAVTTPNTSSPPPTKRATHCPSGGRFCSSSKALHAAGVAADAIAKAVPDGRMRSAPGTLEGDELWDALRDKYGLTEQNRVRWFLDDPLHDRERTWVLFSNWGTNTELTLNALVATAPGFSYQSAG
jgi:hypothetical protein